MISSVIKKGESDRVAFKRNSSIEFLRVIAAFLVVMHHMVELFPIDYNNKICDILLFVLRGHMGNLANCVFMVTSAICLVDSKKPKVDKAIYLILFETLTAVLFSFIKFYVKKPIYTRDIMITISPFLSDHYWWFVNCYIVYYLIHGYINVLINSINKKQHFIICLVMLTFYSIIPMITHFKPPSSQITSFILIHLLVSYIKKYKLEKKISNIKHVQFFGFLYFFLIILVYELDIITKTTLFNWRMNVDTTSSYNIVLLLFIIPLCFNRLKYTFHNNFINQIAGLSFLLFLIHYRYPDFIRDTAWNYCNGLYNYNVDRLIYIFIGVLYYLFCLFLSFIYKKLFHNAIRKLSIAITDKLNDISDKLYKKIG